MHWSTWNRTLIVECVTFLLAAGNVIKATFSLKSPLAIVLVYRRPDGDQWWNSLFVTHHQQEFLHYGSHVSCSVYVFNKYHKKRKNKIILL